MTNQRAAFFNPLRKTLRSYRRVFIDVLFNISVVNSLCLSNKITQSNISITDFWASLVECLINKTIIVINPSRSKHYLEKFRKSMFSFCYQNMAIKKGRKFNQSHSIKTKKCRLICRYTNIRSLYKHIYFIKYLYVSILLKKG